MSDFYSLHGPSIFTILSISHFATASHNRANAEADAVEMRKSFQSLGMIEFGQVMGNTRLIPKRAAINHIDAVF